MKMIWVNFHPLYKQKGVWTETPTSVTERTLLINWCDDILIIKISKSSKIKPLKSLRMNCASCEMKCTVNDGRIPYLYEVL